MSPYPAHRSFLIVDDNPDESFLVQRALEKTGLPNPIVIAGSGKEAKALLRSSCLAAGGRRGDKPALVLLDVKMPLMSGFDVLRWIRRKPALKKLKVVMLSNSDEPTDLARAKLLGADGYLIKYPSVATLAAAARQALLPVPRKRTERTSPNRTTPDAAPIAESADSSDSRPRSGVRST